jgi:hypothetical protein
MAGLLNHYMNRMRQYLEEQDQMKTALAEQMNAEGYASMYDTPYDKAQGFSTGLLARQRFPEANQLMANSVGSTYEGLQTLYRLGKDFVNGSRFTPEQRYEDMLRDMQSNAAAYRYYDEQGITPKMSAQEIMNLGIRYGEGSLFDEIDKERPKKK